MFLLLLLLLLLLLFVVVVRLFIHVHVKPQKQFEQLFDDDAKRSKFSDFVIQVKGSSLFVFCASTALFVTRRDAVRQRNRRADDDSGASGDSVALERVAHADQVVVPRGDRTQNRDR